MTLFCNVSVEFNQIILIPEDTDRVEKDYDDHFRHNFLSLSLSHFDKFFFFSVDILHHYFFSIQCLTQEGENEESVV